MRVAGVSPVIARLGRTGWSPVSSPICQTVALAVQDIDRHEDDALLDTSEVEVDHLDAIPQITAEPVARGQSAREQRTGHTITALVEIAERIGIPVEIERRRIPPAIEGKSK